MHIDFVLVNHSLCSMLNECANGLLMLSNIKIDESFSPFHFSYIYFLLFTFFEFFEGLVHIHMHFITCVWICSCYESNDNFPFHFIFHIPLAITNAHNHQQINDAFWFIHMELISFVSILIRCFETLLFASEFIYELNVANGNAWKTKPYRNTDEHTQWTPAVMKLSFHLVICDEM